MLFPIAADTANQTAMNTTHPIIGARILYISRFFSILLLDRYGIVESFIGEFSTDQRRLKGLQYRQVSLYICFSGLTERGLDIRSAVHDAMCS